jgi:uncharacterized protein (TIGR03663 family)
VSTASTRSRNKKKRTNADWGATKSGKTVPAPPQTQTSDRAWLISSVVILAMAAFLRLYDLNLVPLHHDEGVNGNFLVHLVRDGVYRYDPENYHGPSLYYFAAVIPWTLRLLSGPSAQDKYGLTTFNIRLVPALFGVATIWLVLLLRRRLGTVGTLAAAALLAISPGAVYLSRYFIHESLFAFFTLGIVVAGLKYYEEGNAVHYILAGISAALLFATKETWIISIGVLIIALVSTPIYRWLFGTIVDDKELRGRKFSQWSNDTLERLGGPINILVWSAVAVAALVVVGVLFYSSFMTNWKGVSDSLKTFEVWTKTGQTAHVHPRSTYVLKWLPYQESLVLVLGAAGAAITVLNPKNPFALFSGLWAFGIIAAYSLVPYKTPWLMLSFIVPLALIGGYAVEWANRQLQEYGISKSGRVLAAVAVCALITGLVPNAVLAMFDKPKNLRTAIPAYQTIDLNFANYDNDDEYYVYVYAHTRRDLLKLVDDINLVAQHTPKPNEIGITIVSPDYWPLPWYFRDYTRVGYYAHMAPTEEPIVIASETQRAEAQANFGSRYRLVSSGLNENGAFALRPGVDLLLFVKRDISVP